MNLVRKGRAVHFVHPHSGAHLWVVLSDPDANGRVVAVMIRSKRRFSDCTVELSDGDHPFISHASVVDYGSATYWTVRRLEEWLANQRAHLRQDVTGKLLARLLRGLCASSYTPNEIREYVGCE